MPEEFVVSSCSPTLAGLKTGSLFSCPAEAPETLQKSLRRLNGTLVPRGARILPVKRLQGRILCYLYRPKMLQQDLAGELARSILAARSYPVENTERCVAELIRRLQSDAEFPHEVGLFLGYPPSDVDSFIRLGARQAKCVGVWKVYGDVAAAERRFDLYRKCTRVYREAYGRHNSFDRLVVSCS